MAKNRLIDEDVEELVNKTEKKIEEQIPSSYIPIKLPSNGKLGVEVLHFRDYTGGDVLDLNSVESNNNTKAIVTVLNRMCWEDYDVANLTPQDLNYILMVLHATFISNTISKKIYLNENLPNGKEKGQKDFRENVENVDIPIGTIPVIYLGKDINDKDLDTQIKIPFTITDPTTNNKFKFKLPTVKDNLIATAFVEEKFKEPLSKFTDISQKVMEIENNSNFSELDQEEKLSELYSKDPIRCEEYMNIMQTLGTETSKIVQALQIVSYNDNEITDTKEKLELYQNEIPMGMWDIYEQVLEMNKFGIQDTMEVYSENLGKSVTRRLGFQSLDFLPPTERKTSDRFVLSFD